MGILNVTPDSFSDGNQFLSVDQAIPQLSRLIADGADIIDVGGESSGPGSVDISAEEELRRVKPVIDYIAANGLAEKTLFSIDTYKAPVARYALERGFTIANDVTALRGDPQMVGVLAKYRPYVVLMYSKDPTPRTTRENTQYHDVMAAIKTFLRERAALLLRAGFPENRIILDPGMGMFVSADPKYSYEIIDRLGELKSLGYPILVGPSRKSFLGGKNDIASRDEKSWQIARQAIQNGAAIVRMHGVRKII